MYRFFILLIIFISGCSNIRYVNGIKHAQKRQGIDLKYLNFKSDLMLKALKMQKDSLINIDNNTTYYTLEMYSAESGEVITRIWNDKDNICYIGSNSSNLRIFEKVDSILNEKEMILCEAFEKSDSISTNKILKELNSSFDGYGYMITKSIGYKVQTTITP